MSVDPHGLLAHVHPDLAKIVTTAAQAPVRFMVVYGIRTAAAEAQALASGHSTTMHSRHLPQAHEGGKSCAVDVCVVDASGNLDWTVANPQGGAFGAVAEQMEGAAAKLGLPLQWGGAKVGAWTPGVVSTFHDWGHFQLPWAQYP